MFWQFGCSFLMFLHCIICRTAKNIMNAPASVCHCVRAFESGLKKNCVGRAWTDPIQYQYLVVIQFACQILDLQPYRKCHTITLSLH